METDWSALEKQFETSTTSFHDTLAEMQALVEWRDDVTEEEQAYVIQTLRQACTFLETPITVTGRITVCDTEFDDDLMLDELECSDQSALVRDFFVMTTKNSLGVSTSRIFYRLILQVDDNEGSQDDVEGIVAADECAIAVLRQDNDDIFRQAAPFIEDELQQIDEALLNAPDVAAAVTSLVAVDLCYTDSRLSADQYRIALETYLKKIAQPESHGPFVVEYDGSCLLAGKSEFEMTRIHICDRTMVWIQGFELRPDTTGRELSIYIIAETVVNTDVEDPIVFHVPVKVIKNLYTVL